MTNNFKIKNINIKNKGVLAPMLEYTHLPFRLLCKYYGAGLVFTEMVHTNYIVEQEDLSKISKLKTKDLEKPVGVQIVGDFTNKKEFSKSIYLLDKYKYFDIIDLNLGCPSNRITSNNSGSGLLKNIDSIIPNIKEVIETTTKPITVKTRLGFFENNIKDISRKLINTNISALTIHGRTASQSYSTNSKYKDILKISKDSEIPIIYNGDINLDNLKKFYNLDFNALMIGRSALSNPSIFKNISKEDFNTNYKDLKKILKKLLKYYEKYNCEFNKLKISIISLIKEIPYSKKYRNKISLSKKYKDLKEVIEDLVDRLNK